MGLWRVPPSREGHRVRLLILADARGPLRRQGRRFRRPLGSNPSRDDGLADVSRLLCERNDMERCTLLMPTKIESCEFNVANGKLLGRYSRVSRCARACADRRRTFGNAH
jgi:hypothetical protein